MSTRKETQIQTKVADFVSVSFPNPDGLGWNSSALPVYSGKVIVSGNNGEQVSVPYLGKSFMRKPEYE